MSFNAERKLINIFKNFIEKALIPQVKKIDGSLNQWNKLLPIINAQPLNYNQLQLFVDTLPNNNLGFTHPSNNLNALNIPEKNGFQKKDQNQNSESPAFNPNKTFGGERSKLGVFMAPQQKNDYRRESQREESMRQKTQQNYSKIVSSLGKLLQGLEDNHKIIEGPVDNINGSKSKDQSRLRQPARQIKIPQSKGSSQTLNTSSNYIGQNRSSVNSLSINTPTNYGGGGFGPSPMTPSSYGYSQQQSSQQGHRSYY